MVGILLSSNSSNIEEYVCTVHTYDRQCRLVWVMSTEHLGV